MPFRILTIRGAIPLDSLVEALLGPAAGFSKFATGGDTDFSNPANGRHPSEDLAAEGEHIAGLVAAVVAASAPSRDVYDICRTRRGLWSLAAGRGGGLTSGMFVSEERVLAVSFAIASARLANLTDGGWLREVSENVYQGGVEYLMRVGPVGAVPGVSRLVRVRFTEPAYREGEATVGLRWEVTGMTGGLFPALDADIRLTATEDQGARVMLTGSYRPPLGALGAGLDRLLLHTVATATIRTLLARTAAVLTGAPAEGGQAAQPWLP